MLMPVLLSAFAIPVSMMFWIINVVYKYFSPNSEHHFEGRGGIIYKCCDRTQLFVHI